MAQTDASGYAHEQAKRMRKLFSAVVLATADEFIKDQRDNKTGIDRMRRWANSADGHEVLSLAGIDPGPRTTDALTAFVSRGVAVSKALRRETKEAA